MRRIRAIAGASLPALVAAGMAVTTAAGAEPTSTTLVVDRDRMQCANAGFTSIQAAVDAAQPGDLVRVCPDHYAESVIIDKPITINGDPEAIEAIDCFDPALAQPGDLDATRQAIVDPAGDGFTIALSLRADDIAVDGLVIDGASVGIDASDLFSGYRIHHNLILLNTLFAIDFGSAGERRSRVDHNCLRQNQYGLVSELDDDSLWNPGDGPERDAWNARDLFNARIDHNQTFRNGAGCCGVGAEAAGPGRRDRVSFDHNLLREDWVGVSLQNATHSTIADNQIVSPRFYSALIGGANEALEIRSNTLRGGNTGIRFAPQQFIDLLPTPTRHAIVTDNDISGAVAAIYATTAQSLVDSVIADNNTSDNRGNGISLFSGRNLVRGNQSNNNVVAGITAFPGAIGNRFEYNSMHGNGTSSGASFPGADARDIDAWLTGGAFQNIWIGNDCDTDLPAGMICSIG